MHRFEHTKQRDSKSFWLSILIFICIIGIFYWGIASFSKTADKEQEESLRQAIHRGIVQCYTTEGYYPENIDYLKEHYGLTYNEDRFFVDYQVNGSNIMPDITVLPRN